MPLKYNNIESYHGDTVVVLILSYYVKAFFNNTFDAVNGYLNRLIKQVLFGRLLFYSSRFVERGVVLFQ